MAIDLSLHLLRVLNLIQHLILPSLQLMNLSRSSSDLVRTFLQFLLVHPLEPSHLQLMLLLKLVCPSLLHISHDLPLELVEYLSLALQL